MLENWKEAKIEARNLNKKPLQNFTSFFMSFQKVFKRKLLLTITHNIRKKGKLS